MKILLTDYTIFANRIDINSFPGSTASPTLRIENLLLITKVTTGVHQILYNFASDNNNTSVSGKSIFSNFISTLSLSDNLQIYYDWTDGDLISITQNNNIILIKTLLTTLNDLTDSLYNVSERLRVLDAVRDSNNSLRMIGAGGSISTLSQLNSIIGEIASTSTTAGYLRVGSISSQHNSAAQENINKITP